MRLAAVAARSGWSVPRLLDAGLKGTGVLLAAVGALRLMRRGPAAGRHWACAPALAALLALPAMSAGLPGWGVLPRWADIATVGPSGGSSTAGPPSPAPVTAVAGGRPGRPAGDEGLPIVPDEDASHRLSASPSGSVPPVVPPPIGLRDGQEPIPVADVPSIATSDAERSAHRLSAGMPTTAAVGAPAGTKVVGADGGPDAPADGRLPSPGATVPAWQWWAALVWLVGAIGVPLPTAAGVAALAGLGFTSADEADLRVSAT